MLFAITSKPEIKTATLDLYKRLDWLRPEKYAVRYSSRAGQHEIDICYSNKYDLWWSSSKGPDQYWNPYGLGKPKENAATTGKCQINYALEGLNKSTGGLLARDTNGDLFLLHSGKFGGGKKGIRKNAFADYYTGKKCVVISQEQELEYFVVGKIDSPRFFRNLRDFVRRLRF